MRKWRVAVLMGGPSSEHDVSLATAKLVMDYLDRDKYEAIPVLIRRNGEWQIAPQELKHKADVAFVAMHGEYGEDGRVQKILEDIDLPYTGSGVIPSALGMNKIFSARLLKAYGIKVPEYVPVGKNEDVSKIKVPFGLPVVVKPVDRGSSVGVTVVRREEELAKALEEAFRFSEDAMIQEYISGRELACSVIDDIGGTVVLPVVEIIPKAASFYDYRSKYAPQGSEHVIPARISKEQTDKVQDIAMKVHKYLGAYGMSRTDLILGHDGNIYVLEINTIPGMTPTSLLPQAALQHGITFPELLDKIINAAFRRHNVANRGD
ncbi:D-alanine--D-alanine ligase [Patescibacteria group bacterium]|nr:D-alanine--D-alanine ligase [Patescibacteria group bacterium]